MSTLQSDATMAVFLDLENIVLGAREAKFPDFDVRRVLERLLLKGHIVVKKAYCDFGRYESLKRGLHEAAFELIEIPHRGVSGKNSADIRMVVDALDLCYTKSHMDTFVIISGDSDFSPLVSKLRENNKTVIGMGVGKSTSGLFLSNCDEFIYYDDIVRSEPSKKRTVKAANAAPAPKPVQGKTKGKAQEAAQTKPDGPSPDKALEELTETLEALREVGQGEDGRIWASALKEAIKRRNPGFNERAHGFSSFSALLEEAEKRGLVKLEPKETAGGYRVRPVE